MKNNILRLAGNKRTALACLFLKAAILAFIFGFFKIANVLMIVFAAVWLFDKHILTKVNHSFGNKYVWLFISFFLITLIGFLHSEDLKVAGKFLEMRILIFLLPVIICSMSFEKKQWSDILRIFSFSTLLALIIGLFNSFYLYRETGDSGYFFNDNLTLILNNKAAYFGLYVNLSIVLLLFFLKDDRKNYWYYAALALLTMFQFLLATRISILILFLIAVLSFFYIIKSYSAKVIATVAICFGVIITVSALLMPQTINRFESMLSSFDYRFDNPNEVNHFNAKEMSQVNWNGLTIRLALWDCGLEVIKENPWVGVGTGDYDQEFRNQLEEVNFIYAKKLDFGVHNQYLYTWISFGLLGLLVFLASLLIPAYSAYKAKNYLFLLILMVFAISFLTETVLNRYLGIFPYVVLTSLIFFQYKKE